MIRVVKWLYIDANGYGLINGDKRYRFKICSGLNGWDIGQLEYAFKEACIKYDFPIPEDEEKLSRLLLQATTSAGKRVLEDSTGGNSPQNNDATEESPDEITPSERLYKLALNEINEMFRDEELQTPYAILTIEGKRYVLNMESEQFKFKLRILYENHVIAVQDSDLSPILSEQDVNKVVQQLLARNDVTRKLYLRCYSDGSTTYYDFMNKEYQYAVITPEGYTIRDDAYHIFKRYDDYHVQTLPDNQRSDGGELLDNVIRSFNLIDNEYGDKNLLYKVSLMALFFRTQTRITMPIWTVNGPPGSSKTTLLLYVKSLVDPLNGNPKAMVNRWGREEQTRDRGLIVSKNYFVTFDNMSHIGDSESDELCLYSTGGRWGERKLHTNVDTVNYELQGNVSYTSVNDLAKQSDLISRQLKFELDIRTENVSERIFWNLREKEKPAILHYIFTTLGRAIPIYNRLSDDPNTKTGHRLADFILLCEAIGQAIGQPSGRILGLFNRLEQEQAERSIDNSTFASFFADYVLNSLSQKGNEITMLSKDVFNGLKEHASATNYDTFADVDFPKNPIQLGKKIERIRQPLLKLGIDIKKGERTSAGNPYHIRIIEKKDPDHGTLGTSEGQKQDAQVFKCPFCDHESPSIEELERHSIKMHSGKPFAVEYELKNGGNGKIEA